MIAFNTVEFIKSAAKLEQCPPDEGIEIAFVGRSNAGKSSALNAIMGRKIARTSKTPGQTQLINLFSLGTDHRVVDLPGYGYAKVPDKIRLQIEHILRSYLSERQCLKGVVLLMDIRHPLPPSDLQLINFVAGAGILVHILLTKADKINRGQGQNVLLQVRKELSAFSNVTVQTFSSFKHLGLEEARQKLDHWFSE
jgi:GTP-binding protein